VNGVFANVMLGYLAIGILWFFYVMWRYIANKQQGDDGLLIACVFQWPLTLGPHIRRRLWCGPGKYDVLWFDGKMHK